MVISHAFSALLDELRGCWWTNEQLFFSSRYNPNHVLHRILPNLTTLIQSTPTHSQSYFTDGRQCCYETQFC